MTNEPHLRNRDLKSIWASVMHAGVAAPQKAAGSGREPHGFGPADAATF
jgi:hypothetical protein